MLIFIIFIFDFILIILNLVFGQDNSLLNLSVENNIPTLFQSLKTLSAGVLVLLLTAKKREKIWQILAGVILIFFAFDDWFQIHENIANVFYYLVPQRFNIEHRYTWMIFYLPFLIISTLFFYKLTYKIKKKPFIILGILLLALAFGFEILESLKVCEELNFYRTTLEEGLEMFGVSSLMVAFVFER